MELASRRTRLDWVANRRAFFAPSFLFSLRASSNQASSKSAFVEFPSEMLKPQNERERELMRIICTERGLKLNSGDFGISGRNYLINFYFIFLNLIFWKRFLNSDKLHSELRSLLRRTFEKIWAPLNFFCKMTWPTQKVLVEVEEGFAKLRPRTNPTLEFPMAGLMSGEWSPAKVLVIQNEALKPIHLLIEARHIVHEGVPRNVDPGRHQQPQDQPRNQAGRRPADVDARPSPPKLVPLLPVNLGISPTTWAQGWTAQLVSSGQDHPASQGLRLDCLRINTNLPMPWWTLIQVDDLFANLDFCFFFAFYFSNLEGKSVFLCWSWSFWNLFGEPWIFDLIFQFWKKINPLNKFH